MNNKFSLKLVLLSLFMLSSLMLSGCNSTTGSSSTNAQDIFTKVITLGFLKDVGILNNPIDPIEGFTRFLLLILLFAVLFKGAELLKLGRNVAIVIAAVFSLLTVIFIPGTILLTIGVSYGTIFSVILAGLPIALCFAAYFFLKDLPWIKVIIMGLLWWVLSQMQVHMGGWDANITSTTYTSVIRTVVEWLGTVQYIVIGFFVLSCIQAFISLSSGQSGDGTGITESARWVYGKYLSRKGRQQTAQINQYIEDEKELDLLRDAEKLKEKVLVLVAEVESKGEISTIKERDEIVKGVDNLSNTLEKSIKEFRTVINVTKKETGKSKKASTDAMKEYAENKKKMKTALVREFDFTTLKSLEQDLLVKHDEAIKDLTQAISKLTGAKTGANFVKTKVTTAPAHLTASGSGGGGVVTGLATAIDNIKKSLEAVNIDAAITAQKEAVQICQGIATETRDLYKLKEA